MHDDSILLWKHLHKHAIVNVAHTDRIIEGLRFVFVELPKFKPQTIKERKMAVLWLRFLTEINRGTVVVPAELLENPETSKALQILEKSAYTEEQLYAYERYWDYVNYERGIVKGGYVKGLEKGRAEGRAEGITSVARNLKSLGVAIEDITKATGLSADEIAEL